MPARKNAAWLPTMVSLRVGVELIYIAVDLFWFDWIGLLCLLVETLLGRFSYYA